MAVALLLAAGAASCTHTMSAGMGKPAKFKAEAVYKTQNLLDQYPKDMLFMMRLEPSDRVAQIEHPLELLQAAMNQEVEVGGSKSAAPAEDIAGIEINIVVSRFITRRFPKRTYKTFIDASYRVTDRWNDKVTGEEIISISSSANTPEAALEQAMARMTRRVFAGESTDKLLRATRTREGGGVTGRKLDQLAKGLLDSFKQSDTSGETPCKLAVMGLANDKGETYEGVLMTSLRKYWVPPKFIFFTRRKLDQVLEEQELSRSDFFDSGHSVEVGKLSVADYVVTGNVSGADGGATIEVQVIRVENGSVMASSRVSL